MSKYFSISWVDNPVGPVAFGPENSKLNFELTEELVGCNKLPFDLIIKKVSQLKDSVEESDDLSDLNTIWEDYLPNNIGFALMSDRLKAIVDLHLTGQEDIDWINCKVWANATFKIYYILRFNRKLDVLDIENTKYIPNSNRILKPCYSLLKVNFYNVFHEELSDNLWQINIFIIISEKLKKDIQKGKLTGIEFGKVTVI
ncbi:hypothetical protein SGQ83_00150 [Flavobacterium sp. Fl-318]|uniref:Immunity MXAN-0049 protein domain-containing protein n=1 Tax=Flavobacterium cupriresistens TaxID=2893885 RepID=A0ABU4R5H0_9FLAO|nr:MULTISPECIES: DUF1629 domain-containing protein [unclassified Flavobacterium]MDX6187748.1 hypothetical protein [Flavobacterium sp. Fl-318]UFH42329.1 hypothetical protein LNP23_21300 [Flavobacterium sp. F-323]